MQLLVLERYPGSVITGIRISMINYGYMQYVILIGLGIYILKYKYKYKNLLYFSAMAMLLSQLLTLNRLMLLFVFGGIFLFFLVLVKLLKISINKSVARLSVGLIILVTSIIIFFPKSESNLKRVKRFLHFHTNVNIYIMIRTSISLPRNSI